MRNEMLFSVLGSNALLFLSYAVTRPGGKDFGRITNSRLRTYLLASAGVCLLLLYVIVALAYTRYSAGEQTAVAVCLCAYLLLQIAFIPLVRRGDRKRVLLLLFACVLPIASLAVALRERLEALFLALICVAHVLGNDCLVYGLLF